MPVRLSLQAIKISFNPLFFISVKLFNQILAYGIWNPDTGIAKFAERLVFSKAVSAAIIKIANDDAAVSTKTKQEQSLLFIANLAQVATGKAKETMQHLVNQGTRSIGIANVTHEADSSNINNHLSGSIMVAVAAGDEATGLITKEALWVAGTFASSSQGEYKG